MEADIDSLTVDFTDENGVQVTKELDKKVLTKGAWSTLIFKFAEINKTTGEFGPPKATIRRYQKQQGVYKMRSKFNISSATQAKQLVSVLSDWFENQTDNGSEDQD